MDVKTLNDEEYDRKDVIYPLELEHAGKPLAKKEADGVFI